MNTTRLGLVFGISGLLAILSGCSGKAEPPGMVAARLERASSCPDLEAMLKADAKAKLNAYIDGAIESLHHRSSGVVFDAANSGATPPKSGNPSPDRATTWSKTNTQVDGVDEADIVKNDDKFIYVLHGSTLQIVDAFPAAKMASSSSTTIDGTPNEMFVAGNQIVVFSTVSAGPIFQAAGITRKPRYGYYGGGWWGGDIAGPMCMGWGCGSWISDPITKVTVLTVAGTTPSVARELYFEGSYVSSRRVGGKVRAITSGGAYAPELLYYPTGNVDWNDTDAMTDAYEAIRAEDLRRIDASTFADWVPVRLEKINGVVKAQTIACSDVMLPTTGSTEYGLSQLVTFDLDAPQAEPSDLAIAGAVDVVYGNEDTMLLAQRGWRSGWWWERDDLPEGFSYTYTHVHAFDVKSDPSHPTYVGSGTVNGIVDDQFALDEKNGVVRVAATEQRSIWRPGSGFFSSGYMGFQSVGHVYTLQATGGTLAPTGSVGDLVKEERITATRFVGDTAYVVTYRNVDPLFVIDTKDPKNPKVLGELTIPGFSEYMHPLDATHLLTIGRGANVGSLALQIFDVTDPAHPKQTWKYEYVGDWGYSEAESNHKAFTYYPEKKLLSFPHWTYPSGGFSFRSSAELFQVDATTGIKPVGSVDHTALFPSNFSRGWCGGYYGADVRRSVFMDDVMYSVSYGGIVATDTKTMGQVRTLGFGRPVIDGWNACYGE
jgi:uncharacterized secreted protein with C-terminal beta-propeller domain